MFNWEDYNNPPNVEEQYIQDEHFTVGVPPMVLSTSIDSDSVSDPESSSELSKLDKTVREASPISIAEFHHRSFLLQEEIAAELLLMAKRKNNICNTREASEAERRLGELEKKVEERLRVIEERKVEERLRVIEERESAIEERESAIEERERSGNSIINPLMDFMRGICLSRASI